MTKRIDYFITNVSYGYGNSIIKELRVRKFVNNKLEEEKTFEREQVINLISVGFIFYTLDLNDEGVGAIGSEVIVARTRNLYGNPTEYLTTVGNNEKFDNLGELPTF